MASERVESFNECFERWYRQVRKTTKLRWTAAERVAQAVCFLVYLNPEDELDNGYGYHRGDIDYSYDITEKLVQEYVRHEEAISLKYSTGFEIGVPAGFEADEDDEPMGQHFERFYHGVGGNITGAPWAAEKRAQYLKQFLMWVDRAHPTAAKKLLEPYDNDDLTVDLVVQYIERKHDLTNFFESLEAYGKHEPWEYWGESRMERSWERFHTFRCRCRFHSPMDNGEKSFKMYTRFLVWAHQQKSFSGKPLFHKDITADLVEQYQEYELTVVRRVRALLEPLADIPDHAEPQRGDIIHGVARGQGANKKEKDGSVASRTTVGEGQVAVKRGLSSDDLEGDELQRRVRFRLVLKQPICSTPRGGERNAS